MKKEKALEFIASQLAHQTFEHIQAARELPRLKENTRLAVLKIREVAKSLDIFEQYEASLSHWNVYPENQTIK